MVVRACCESLIFSKSETRNPKSERNPKPEEDRNGDNFRTLRLVPLCGISDFGLRICRANTGRLSLTPCFSWVKKWHRRQNRFNGLQQSVETVETVPASFDAVFTQLKQGVNERTSKLRSIGHEICAPGSEAVLAPMTSKSFLRSIFNVQFAEPRLSTLNTGCSTLSII